MQDLIEKLEHTKMNSCKHLYEVVFFDGILAIIEGGEFLEKEKKQIANAHDEGLQNPDSYGGITYYNETFNP